MADAMLQPGAKMESGRAGDSPAPALLSVRLAYGLTESPNAGLPRPWKVARRRGQDAYRGPGLHVDFSLTERANILFGASGAGKSTLLRLLAGLLKPTTGFIALQGRTLTDTAWNFALPPGQRGIGYLTQEPALFPHLSVEENIAYGLSGQSRAAREARLSAMLTLFSLESLARRLPLGLSGGERQRVALARALAPRPSLLLMDEPFASLDAPLRARTTAALDRYLQSDDTTVLTVSHDVAEVYASGAQVLLLEEGRITAHGPSQRVLAEQRALLLRRLGAREL